MRIDMHAIHLCTQPASDPLLAEAESSSISYTPEQYGTWEAFTRHPDYERTKQQYGQIFTDIDTLINRHAYHPEPQQAAFAQFIIRIFSGYFTDRATLIYGEGKRLFDTFHTLIQHEDIALEKRLTAIRNLSQEIRACADGAVNSLIGIVRQLQCQLAGNRGEVQQIREQLLEQLILAFHRQKLAAREEEEDEEENELMEKHHIAAYHNFLRPRYDLPSLGHDIFASQASLGISDGDLNACAKYVATRLTPMRIVTLLAENYLAEVQAIFPPQGLSWYEAKDTLEALRTQLAPLYGEISDLFVLEDKDELYQPVRRPIRLTITILRLLQQEGLIDNPVITRVSCDTMPDRVIRLDVHDPVTGTRREEKRRLAGEEKSIYMAEGEFWLSSDQDPAPQFVTLDDVSDLFMHRPPYLSVLTPDHIPALILEAVRNSTDETLVQTLAAHPRIPPLLLAYLQTRATPDKSIDAFVKLLSGFEVDKADRDLIHLLTWLTLIDLNYTHLVKQEWDTIQMLEAMYLFLLSSDKCALDNSSHLSEAFILNFYSEKFSLAEHYHPDFFSESLMTVALKREWLTLTEHIAGRPETDINAVNESGQTALMLAAEQGNISLMKTLVSAGADLSLFSPGKGSALHHAVRASHIAAFEYLLSLHTQSPADFDINAYDSYGGTLLLYLLSASRNTPNRKDMLLALLKYGADVRICTRDGISVLATHYAFHDDGCYQILLDAGADIAADDYGYILHNIIRYLEAEKALPLIQQILNRRASTPHLPGKIADSLLTLSAETEQGMALYAPLLLPHLQHCLPHKARACYLFDIGSSRFASHYSQTVLSRFMQSLMAPEWIRRPDRKGKHFLNVFLTFFRWEAEASEIPEVFSFLTRHVDMTLPMADGDTLLMHLIKNAESYLRDDDIPAEYLYPIIDYLATHTTLLSLPDNEGFTPFIRAVQLSHKAIIELLLTINTQLIHSRDPQGNTPLDIASRNGRDDIVALLLQHELIPNAERVNE